jgi:hypothetical protein
MAKKTTTPSENAGTLTFEKPETVKAQPEPTNQAIQVSETSPLTLLDRAVMNGAGIDTLERLMALYERHEATKARKNFFEAKANFQKNRPQLQRSNNAKITSKDPNKAGYSYKFIDLNTIAEAMKDCLYDNGFSYEWKIEKDGAEIKVTCILTHADGHSESTSMSAPDDDSGGKNKIQQKGSTVSYLQRYTLIGVLGITSADLDDDGHRHGKPETTDEVVAGNGPKATPEILANVVKYIMQKGQPEYDRAMDHLSFDRSQVKALDVALNSYNKNHPAA